MTVATLATRPTVVNADAVAFCNQYPYASAKINPSSAASASKVGGSWFGFGRSASPKSPSSDAPPQKSSTAKTEKPRKKEWRSNK